MSAPRPPDAATALAGFARAARAAGCPGDPHRTRGFLEACAAIGADDLDGVYWAGRATLAPGPEAVPAYDAAFARWFSGASAPSRRVGHAASVRVRSVPEDGAPPPPAPGATGDPDLAPATVVASDRDILRTRDLAELGPAELAEVARMFAAVRPRAPRRRGRRWAPAPSGPLDVRRTVRSELRRAGLPGPLLHRRRPPRARRVVLLLDVSGSMAGYADALLRLAHVWVRSAPTTTEAFTMGTRLTRVTPPLRSADPRAALLGAGRAVPDWSGGTRLGEVVRAFLEGWGGRGTARGAVVVIVSDGWERGDARLLGEQVARLRRLAHRVVWVSPHRGRAGYRAVQSGIVAALPSCDAFLAGHSLQTFVELSEVVADA